MASSSFWCPSSFLKHANLPESHSPASSQQVLCRESSFLCHKTEDCTRNYSWDPERLCCHRRVENVVCQNQPVQSEVRAMHGWTAVKAKKTCSSRNPLLSIRTGPTRRGPPHSPSQRVPASSRYSRSVPPMHAEFSAWLMLARPLSILPPTLKTTSCASTHLTRRNADHARLSQADLTRLTR